MSYGFKYSKGSFLIDNNGHIIISTGVEKVEKEVYKHLITNRVGSQYGNQSRSLIGTKLKPSSVDLNLKKYVKEAITSYALIQRSNKHLTDDETVIDADLDTWFDDPNNSINYKTTVKLKTGQTIETDGQPIKIGY